MINASEEEGGGGGRGEICLDSCTCCHTEAEVADSVTVSSCHRILRLGLPVLALAVQRQTHGRVYTRAPILTHF